MPDVTKMPIPKGVYWSAESANFYDYNRKGLGSGFYDMWKTESHRFPHTLDEALIRMQWTRNDTSGFRVTWGIFFAYLHLAAGCVVPVAFQHFADYFPQIHGIGYILSMVLMTCLLITVGMLKYFAEIRKN